MDRLTVSVIVVSRGRRSELSRCMTAIAQLRYHPFEVIVVADRPGVAAAKAHPAGVRARVILFDQPGISDARNAGLSMSGGEIVAFLDDDAVPEPMWLHHLVAAFTAPEVGAATGPVRGRNGISYQWRQRTVAPDGSMRPLDPSAPGRAVMTEGTNMAFRRSLFERIGGFDSSFSFLFDDADMALRVSVSGSKTAFVPLAEVHHGYAASARRRKDRVPITLFDNGRSLALFLRKHGGGGTAVARVADWRASERRRLLTHMVAGRIEPRDVGRLLQTFDSGATEGMAEPLGKPAKIGAASRFSVFSHPSLPEPLILAGRPWERARLRRLAREAALAGRCPSLFVFSPTSLYHILRYTEDGYWEQRGGVFGRSHRGGRVFRALKFGERLTEEIERVAAVRGIHDTSLKSVRVS